MHCTIKWACSSRELAGRCQLSRVFKWSHGSCDYGTFTIDKEHRKIVLAGTGESRAVALECVISAAAGHNGRHPPREARTLEELRKAMAASGPQRLTISAAFDVDFDFHQRFPPISPRRHSCPREYFFNHSAKAGCSNRRIVDSPFCFSHTITSSGDAERLSTKTSEWVVTTSCVRVECLFQQFADAHERIRMQTQFRLLNTQQRRRRGMAQQDQQA